VARVAKVAMDERAEAINDRPRRAIVPRRPTSNEMEETMATLQLTAGPSLDLRKVSRSYDTATRPEGEGDDILFNEAIVVQAGVRLEGGVLTVAGRTVSHPRFERDTISWSEHGPGGYFGGVLHFLPNGLAFTGRIFAGASGEQAAAEIVAGAAPPTVFTTRVGKDGAASNPPTPPDASGWEPGVKLTLGYKLPEGNGFPEPIIKLGEEDATQYVALTVDKDTPQHLVVTVVFDQSMAALGSAVFPDWPAKAEVKLAWDGASFSGWICPYDAKTGLPSALEHVWAGEGKTAAPAALAVGQAAAAAVATSLSVSDLLTQAPIGADRFANNLLVQNLQWAIPDDWRTDFFGVAKPDLSGDPARVALINKSIDFYRSRLGPAYIGWSVNNVAGAGAPEHPLSAAEKRALEYYLHDGLAQDKDYNVQSQGIALEAFVDACPRLAQYIADTSHNWAQEAFDALTKPAFFTNTMLQIVATGQMALPNRYTSILNTLQPSGDLAAKYYRAILTRTLTHISDQLDLSNADAVGAWLPDVIEAFINEFITAPANPTKAQLELQEQAEALRKAASMLGGIAGLGGRLTTIVVATNTGSLTGSAKAAAEEFAKQYPTLAKAGRSFLVMFWAGGVVSSVIGACSWSTLNTRQRIGLVTGIVNQFAKLVDAVPAMLDVGSWVGEAGMKMISEVRGWFSTPTSLADLDALFADLDDTWYYTLCKNIASMFDAAKGIVTDGTLLARFFKFVPTMMKWLGALTAGVFAGLSIWQFVDDLKTGASTLQIAFDGVIMATSVIVLVCAIAEIAVDLVFIPVLGAIAAIIGAIIAIIAIFVPQPKKKTPVDNFMDNTLRPFVDKLPTPPANWAPPGQTAKAALIAA
jgi:hypothetical protein